jgi:GNAT superfamily N-acetyltransferase
MMVINKTKLKIRKVELSDVPELVAYRLDYLAELQGERDEVNKIGLQEELVSYFFKALDEKRFFALVAEYERKTVGFGGMVIKQIPGDFNKSSYLEGDILNMYTVPEARRQGISSLILERLLLEAGAIGISKVALHTSKDGEKLYGNFGFTEPEYPYLELVLNS